MTPPKPTANISSLLGRRKRRLLDEDSDWAPDEVEKLYKVREHIAVCLCVPFTTVIAQALSSVELPTTDPLYWSKIGAAVGRSASDCFERFHRAHPTPGT